MPRHTRTSLGAEEPADQPLRRPPPGGSWPLIWMAAGLCVNARRKCASHCRQVERLQPRLEAAPLRSHTPWPRQPRARRPKHC